MNIKQARALFGPQREPDQNPRPEHRFDAEEGVAVSVSSSHDDVAVCYCGEPEDHHVGANHTFTPMISDTLSPEALDRLERVELDRLERLDDRQTARSPKKFWTPDKEPGIERNPFDKTLTVKCPTGLVVKVKPLTLRDEAFIDNFQRKRGGNPRDLISELLERKCEIIERGPYRQTMDWKELLVADGEFIAKALKG